MGKAQVGSNMRVLATGGAGYVGSHAVQRLLGAGHEVVVFDNLSTGFKEAVPSEAVFCQGDVLSSKDLRGVFETYRPSAVVHFAAKLNVKESLEQPLEYYQTNVAGLLNVLQLVKEFGVEYFILSSTGSIFGDEIQSRPIREDDPAKPINPYGRSKQFSEMILEDVAKVYGFKYCTLRYFNVAGAAENGENGQRTAKPYHLIHLGAQVVSGKKTKMSIYGTDYPTSDGTCVRDYIHVEDLADAHHLALEYLKNGGDSVQLNCGYGRGFSVREVVNCLREVSGVPFEVTEDPRRPGDPVSLVADSSKAKKVLGWQPVRDKLELICRSAISWERSHQLKGPEDR